MNHKEFMQALDNAAEKHNVTQENIFDSVLNVDPVIYFLFGREKVIEMLCMIADLRNIRGELAGKFLNHAARLSLAENNEKPLENFEKWVMKYDIRKVR